VFYLEHIFVHSRVAGTGKEVGRTQLCSHHELHPYTFPLQFVFFFEVGAVKIFMRIIGSDLHHVRKEFFVCVAHRNVQTEVFFEKIHIIFYLVEQFFHRKIPE